MVLANNAVYSPGKTAVNAGGGFGADATVSANHVQGSSSVALDSTRLLDGGTAAATFVDAPNRDFWPRTGSILLDRGVAAHAAPNDFNRTARATPIDVGAYETLGLTANPGWRIVEGFKLASAGAPGADSSAPTVAISAPSPGAGELTGMVSLAAPAADNVAVAAVQFRLDGANLGAEMTGAPYTMVWDSTSVANGTHALTAVARDASGNSTTSSPLTLIVNNAVQGRTPTPGPDVAAAEGGAGGCTTGRVQGLDPLLLAYAALSALVLARRRSRCTSGRHDGAGRIEHQVEVGVQHRRHPQSPAALETRAEHQ
jgi:hypothetical protein